MIDIKLIRDDPEWVEKRLRTKDPATSLERIIELDKKIRRLRTETDELKNIRNVVSKDIGKMRNDNVERDEKITKMKEVSERIKRLDDEIEEYEKELMGLMYILPNLPHETVPVSDNPEDKVVLREYGRKPEFRFEYKNHLEIGKRLSMLDMERGAKISKSQFPMYTGVGAQLEWSLIQYMIEVNSREKGYKLIIPPYLVNWDTMFTSGNLPKFEEQLYKCRDDELYLIPTSEVPLCSIHRDEILREDELPLYYCAYTANFRREAGAYGKEERGLIRVHQFNKVEMFKFATPETSYDEFDKLVRDAEDLVERLGLHYRVTLLVTGDIGQQSAKTCDIEVWIPGQDRYYEVSSCSNCEDYQARRGRIRYRPAGGGSTRFVHTLNGSGLATSRLMAALLETYQREDGAVEVPHVLRKYMGGLEVITV